MICDFAETYHIYDYKSLPPTRAATFCVGLRENGRIKLKMSGLKYSLETLLAAAMVDKLTNLIWMQSGNTDTRPTSVLASLLEENEEKEVKSFDTPDEFERAKRNIVGRRSQ